MQAHYHISERWGCRVIRYNRATQRYITKRDDRIPLKDAYNRYCPVKDRYGYKRIHMLILREGWKVNHKEYTGYTARKGLIAIQGKEKENQTGPGYQKWM